MSELTYAIGGGPPDDWHGLRVFDAGGNEIEKVIEVNTAEGWLVRCKVDENGDVYAEGDEVATERIAGTFIIKRPGEL